MNSIKINIDENRDYEKNWNDSLFEDSVRYNSFSEILAPEIVETISRFCLSLKYSAEIEFTCVVNIDRFFKKKYQQLKETAMRRSQVENKYEMELLLEMIESMQSEVVLHIVNMIMICAKFTDSNVLVPIGYFVKILEKIQRPHDLDQLKSMEFTVYEMIDFKIHPATAYYSSMHFLDICLQRIPAEREKACDICIDLLRLVFLRRNFIYDALNSDETFTAVERFRDDQIFLGVSVALAVFVLLRVRIMYIESALNNLSNISQIPCKSILAFSIAIKNAIEDSDEIKGEDSSSLTPSN